MTVKRKVVLLGDSSVGKTSLIRRYVHNRYDDAYITTIGSKVSKKDLVVPRGDESVDLTLLVWDLIGREGYQATQARNVAGSHGAILVADLTRRETLKSLERYWIPLLLKVVETPPLVFAANKMDLSDEAGFVFEEMQEIAAKYNVGLGDELPSDLASAYLTSAKTGENVERAFETLGRLIVADKKPEDPTKDLFESLVALGMRRDAERGTPLGVLDIIITDFCEALKDDEVSMTLLRTEVARAGLDINAPTKEGVAKLVEYLSEAESGRVDEAAAIANRARRLEWVDDLG